MLLNLFFFDWKLEKQNKELGEDNILDFFLYKIYENRCTKTHVLEQRFLLCWTSHILLLLNFIESGWTLSSKQNSTFEFVCSFYNSDLEILLTNNAKWRKNCSWLTVNPQRTRAFNTELLKFLILIMIKGGSAPQKSANRLIAFSCIDKHSNRA